VGKLQKIALLSACIALNVLASGCQESGNQGEAGGYETEQSAQSAEVNETSSISKVKPRDLEASEENCAKVNDAYGNYIAQVSRSIGVNKSNIKIIGARYEITDNNCQILVETPLETKICFGGVITSFDDGETASVYDADELFAQGINFCRSFQPN
jgi:hypothetical protein